MRLDTVRYYSFWTRKHLQNWYPLTLNDPGFLRHEGREWISSILPSLFSCQASFVLFCSVRFLSKAKPNTLHFGEMKMCRCILYQTQNQATSDTAQGDKLLGEPVAAQSLAAMMQATGVRLSPAIDREEQTTNRVRKLRRKKVKLLTNSRCAETSGWSYAFPSDLPYCLYNFATPRSVNTWSCSYIIMWASNGLAHFLWEILATSALQCDLV